MDWMLEKPKPNNRTNDSILLYRYLDHEFYGKIVIGHPGQTLNVAFDTTWTYSWVLSSECSDIETIGCYFHNKYDHTKSSEFKPDGRKFSIKEGPYNLTGYFSYDNISIAHSNVTNYDFIEMTYVPYTFIFNKADGVMGLGKKADLYDPFFYTLLNQKRIKDPVFSIYLNRNHQSDKGGNILLGFVDKKHIKVEVIDGKKVYDEIKYMPTDPLSYWQFDMDEIVMVHNPKKNDTFCANGCKAVIDTSTSTIIGPADEVTKIHKLIGASKTFLNRYTVPCDKVDQLPKLNFVIGGKNFILTGRSYITKFTWRAISVCVSTFQGAETPSEKNKWFLGGSFLTEVYTIYDVSEKKIGLVRAA
ncbi:hypothetical protein HHI36_001939 [Cryptolaemus montrouzieri]